MEKDICWSEKILYAHNRYSQVRRNRYEYYDVILIISGIGNNFRVWIQHFSWKPIRIHGFDDKKGNLILQFTYP